MQERCTAQGGGTGFSTVELDVIIGLRERSWHIPQNSCTSYFGISKSSWDLSCEL